MSAYGYEIVQTLIVDIEPDVHVKRAMNEINAGNLFLVDQKLLLTCINIHIYMQLFIYLLAFQLSLSKFKLIK